jgi:hypothetical protein
MRRIAAKFVPRLLSNDQKEHRVAVCSDLKEQKMKLKLKRRRFESTEEIQAESQNAMKMLTQNDFQQCIR